MIYPGIKIGAYKIEDEIGRGGFGSVYLARDENSGSRVAIKLLHPKILASEDVRQSFIDEMINQARLSLNPNIVHIIKSIRYVDKQGEHLGMVMEYVDGESLDSFIQRYSLLPDYVAVPIFIQVLNGLAFAHRHNILHRDIKPGNILIGRNGLVKIMDFGLSKMVNTSVAASESARAASLNYVAPERLRKQAIDQRTDIYSLGATFYEALTGRPPYEIEPGDWKDAEAKHASGRFASICEFYQGHSRELETIVNKALSSLPDKRYPLCDEMISDLTRLNARLAIPDRADPQFRLIREASERTLKEAGGERAPAAPTKASPGGEDAERRLFEHAKGLGSSESYRDYMEKYPTGAFIDEARAALRELESRPLDSVRDVPAVGTAQPPAAARGGPDIHFGVKPKWRPPKAAVIALALAAVLGLLAWGIINAGRASERRADQMSWEAAQKTHTVTSYQWYLDKFPKGRFRQKAVQERDALNSPAK